jgi:hypothetical protein
MEQVQHARHDARYDAPEPTDGELFAGLTPAEVLAGPGKTELRRQWREEHRLPDPLPAGPPATAGPTGGRWSRLAARLRTSATTAKPARVVAPKPPAAAEPARADRPVPARRTRSAAARPAPTRVARRIAVALAALLAVVIVVAFRGSWTSQSDAARASHFDDWGAWLYPFAPDGLIVLALVGAVVLRHRAWPRWYCLGVVTLFTATSLVINHLHGLGKFLMTDGVLIKALEPWIVGLVAVQLVGAIAFGSHILMHIFKHLFPEALDALPAVPTPIVLFDESAEPVGMSDPQEADDEPPTAGVDRYEFAKLIYAACLDGGVKLTQARLSDLARISKRRAGYARVDVETERAQAAADGAGAPDRNDQAGQELGPAATANGSRPGGGS